MIPSFLVNAFLVVILFAFVSASLGVLVNLRRAEFVVDGLSHSIFPGIVLGVFVQLPLLGAFLFGFLGVVFVSFFVSRRGRFSELFFDPVVGVVLAGFFGFGVVLVSRFDSFGVSLSSVLFGSVFSVSSFEVLVFGFLVLGVSCLVWVFWQWFLADTFEFSSVGGAGFGGAGFWLLLLNLVAVVAGSVVFGSLLVLAWMILPSAAARFFVSSSLALVIFSGIFAFVSGILGVWVSWVASVGYNFLWSPSAVVALLMCVLFCVCWFVSLLVFRSGVGSGFRFRFFGSGVLK